MGIPILVYLYIETASRPIQSVPGHIFNRHWHKSMRLLFYGMGDYLSDVSCITTAFKVQRGINRIRPINLNHVCSMENHKNHTRRQTTYKTCPCPFLYAIALGIVATNHRETIVQHHRYCSNFYLHRVLNSDVHLSLINDVDQFWSCMVVTQIRNIKFNNSLFPSGAMDDIV